jgi:hypothetical protein
MGAVTWVGIALSVAGSGALVAYLAWAGRQTLPGGPIPGGEEARRFLWWGLYVNPEDPRGWLLKPTGVGTTVNFRTRTRAAGFLGLILLTALGAALTVAGALGA